MFSGYYQIRDWLESFIPQVYSKENLGLERIEYLLKLLGNPQEKFKSIHIAGTSGKGSTAYYTARLLKESKSKRVKVGLHLSPHLVDIRERMQIFKDEGLMPMDKFVNLFNQVAQVVEKIKKEKSGLTPSYFEILVAASFLYFAKEKVDWAVVEVGLGGRLDATNVLRPKVCVITNVGLDHTDILGRSIEKIAFEKAGIIKKQVPVITAAQGKALKVIEKVAKDKKAPLIKIDVQRPEKSLNLDIFSNITKPIDILRYLPKNLVLENVLLAITTISTLGFKLDSIFIKKAFTAGFAGRFEEIDKGVILDGAHNPQKIRFLIKMIKKQLTTNNLQMTNKKSNVSGQMSIVLIIAFKKGKEWKKMLDLLMNELLVKEVFTTKFNAVTDTGWYAAVKPQEIKNYLESKGQRVKVRVFANSQEAVFEALNESVILNVSEGSIDSSSSTQNDKPLVLLTGSLYLVGEVRTMWYLPSFA